MQEATDDEERKRARRRRRALFIAAIVVGLGAIVALSPLGGRIYMNLRPADPLLQGWEAYEPRAFAELMRGPEPILVEIYASWCPTCLAQQKAFRALSSRGQLPHIRYVRVDFDRDRDFVERYRAEGTGLLIFFDEGREIARAAGLVVPEDIDRFLRRVNARVRAAD